MFRGVGGGGLFKSIAFSHIWKSRSRPFISNMQSSKVSWDLFLYFLGALAHMEREKKKAYLFLYHFRPL